MKNKIGLIVEGGSDKKFFDDYFKKQFGFTKKMIVLPSGTGNTCKIMNERTVKCKIKDLRDKNCSEIYILLDLDSTCKKNTYDCVVELKKDYISKLKFSNIENLEIIVVSSEIEAWMLSAWKLSDKKSKQDLQQHFSIKSSKNLEETLFKKFIASKENIKPQNNQSLRYFLKKLDIV